MISIYLRCILNKKRISVLIIGMLILILFIIFSSRIFEPESDQILNSESYRQAYYGVFDFLEIFYLIIIIFLIYDHDEPYTWPYIALTGRKKNFFTKYAVFLFIILSCYILMAALYMAIPLLFSHYFFISQEVILMLLSSFFMLTIPFNVVFIFITKKLSGFSFLIMIIYIALNFMISDIDSYVVFYLLPVNNGISVNTILGIPYQVVYNVILFITAFYRQKVIKIE